MTFPKDFFDEFIRRYVALCKQSDRLEDKMAKAEAEGDMKKYQKLDRKDDQTIAEMYGMTQTLRMMGYDLCWNHGEPFIFSLNDDAVYATNHH